MPLLYCGHRHLRHQKRLCSPLWMVQGGHLEEQSHKSAYAYHRHRFVSVWQLPTGYTGVRTTFGQISQETVPNGFVWKIPFVQSIEKVNNKQQDVRFKAEVWGEATDKTPVYASDIIVTYQITPGNGAWIYANVSDTNSLISQEIVASATKTAMVQLGVNEVTVRSKIEPAVKDELARAIDEKYGEGKINILKVTINQMDFEPAYNDAIQQKSLAQQEQERQRIENQTAIEKAQADKTVAITNAESRAEIERITAEAEANATRISAEAEADANAMLRESLTDEILAAKFYETWNGELPNAIGSDTIISNFPLG